MLKTSITGDNSISTFTAGECAMLVSGPWALADIQKAGINYALGPVPGFAGMAPAQPFTGVQAFYVASNGKNKSFAESFVLDSANTPETMKALYDAEARPPAMTSVLDEVSGSDPDTAAFAEAAAGGQILLGHPADGRHLGTARQGRVRHRRWRRPDLDDDDRRYHDRRQPLRTPRRGPDGTSTVPSGPPPLGARPVRPALDL